MRTNCKIGARAGTKADGRSECETGARTGPVASTRSEWKNSREETEPYARSRIWSDTGLRKKSETRSGSVSG